MCAFLFHLCLYTWLLDLCVLREKGQWQLSALRSQLSWPSLRWHLRAQLWACPSALVLVLQHLMYSTCSTYIWGSDENYFLIFFSPQYLLWKISNTAKLNKLYSELPYTHHLDSILFYLLHHIPIHLSICLSIHLVFLYLSRRVANFSTFHP